MIDSRRKMAGYGKKNNDKFHFSFFGFSMDKRASDVILFNSRQRIDMIVQILLFIPSWGFSFSVNFRNYTLPL